MKNEEYTMSLQEDKIQPYSSKLGIIKQFCQISFITFMKQYDVYKNKYWQLFSVNFEHESKRKMLKRIIKMGATCYERCYIEGRT
jgi:hypothetical protein